MGWPYIRSLSLTESKFGSTKNWPYIWDYLTSGALTSGTHCTMLELYPRDLAFPAAFYVLLKLHPLSNPVNDCVWDPILQPPSFLPSFFPGFSGLGTLGRRAGGRGGRGSPLRMWDWLSDSPKWVSGRIFGPKISQIFGQNSSGKNYEFLRWNEHSFFAVIWHLGTDIRPQLSCWCFLIQ